VINFICVLAAVTTAASPDTQVSGAWVTGFVVAVIGAISAALAHRAGRSSRVQIDHQPLAIKMEDHFVTRREFDSFRAEMALDITDIKGLFEKTMTKLDSQNTALTADIRAMGTGAYEGRQKIWNQVNEHRERIAVVEARLPAIPNSNRKPGQ
jgi:hypothetical protein